MPAFKQIFSFQAAYGPAPNYAQLPFVAGGGRESGGGFGPAGRGPAVTVQPIHPYPPGATSVSHPHSYRAKPATATAAGNNSAAVGLVDPAHLYATNRFPKY